MLTGLLNTHIAVYFIRLASCGVLSCKKLNDDSCDKCKKPIPVLHAIYQAATISKQTQTHMVPSMPMVLYVSIIYLIGCHHWAHMASPAMTDDVTSGLPDDITMTTVTLTMGHRQMHLQVTWWRHKTSRLSGFQLISLWWQWLWQHNMNLWQVP